MKIKDERTRGLFVLWVAALCRTPTYMVICESYSLKAHGEKTLWRLVLEMPNVQKSPTWATLFLHIHCRPLQHVWMLLWYWSGSPLLHYSESQSDSEHLMNAGVQLFGSKEHISPMLLHFISPYESLFSVASNKPWSIRSEPHLSIFHILCIDKKKTFKQ